MRKGQNDLKHLNVRKSIYHRQDRSVLLFLKVDFWTHSSLRGTPVDIRLAPGQVYRNITSLLNSHNIKFQVQISDLQSAIKRQNRNWRNKREESSWFEKYHTLAEVGDKERKA